MHEVYSQSVGYGGFLARGEAITFDLPKEPRPVVSGLRLGNRVLVKRTEFGNDHPAPVTMRLHDGGEISVQRGGGLRVVEVRRRM